MSTVSLKGQNYHHRSRVYQNQDRHMHMMIILSYPTVDLYQKMELIVSLWTAIFCYRFCLVVPPFNQFSKRSYCDPLFLKHKSNNSAASLKGYHSCTRRLFLFGLFSISLMLKSETNWPKKAKNNQTTNLDISAQQDQQQPDTYISYTLPHFEV